MTPHVQSCTIVLAVVNLAVCLKYVQNTNILQIQITKYKLQINYYKSQIQNKNIPYKIQQRPCCLTTGLTSGPEKATENPLLLLGKYAYLKKYIYKQKNST